MIRAIEVIPAGAWRGPPADIVELDREQRHRRRVAMVGRGNTQFLLDLAEAVVLRHGDGLMLEDGRLIAVEGIDGSGKTTQLGLLAKWLSAAGHPVFVTEWNSSALVKAATKTGKKKNSLTPMTFSLLHATDFADRLLYNIVPPLKAGMIVLADRYAYTAFARDAARGVDRGWVRELYSFAVQPDLAVYFRVPIEVSTDRLMARRVKLKFYEAGLDMGWSTNALESFRMFQGKVLDEYERIVEEFGLSVVAASGSITEQQRVFRRLVSQHLEIEDDGAELDEQPG